MSLKKIQTIALFFIGTFSVAFLTNAFAEFYNLHQGFYLSGNLGSTLSGTLTHNNQSESGFMGFAGNFFVGKAYNPNFAIEGGYGYYDSSLAGTSIIDFVGKGTLPLGSRATLFAKLGIAYTELRTCFFNCSTYTQFAPAFGLGAGVGINKNWTSTFEYNGVYMSSTDSSGLLGALTIGVTRYFDA
jgi:hypothetical protein